MIINAKTRNVVFEYGKAASEGQKGPFNGGERLADKEPVQPAKRAKKAVSGGDSASSAQMATDEQKQYIEDNASDADYERIIAEYGFKMENLTANQAAAEIKKIEAPSTMVKCERCDKIITGVALPDGTTMTAGELIGKSKLAYNGVYCWSCAAELKKARNKKVG